MGRVVAVMVDVVVGSQLVLYLQQARLIVHCWPTRPRREEEGAGGGSTLIAAAATAIVTTTVTLYTFVHSRNTTRHDKPNEMKEKITAAAESAMCVANDFLIIVIICIGPSANCHHWLPLLL